jgi:hypothetical protein
VNDEQYRLARAAINQPPCLYEKALQYGYFGCQHAHNIALGEREAIHCGSKSAYSNCHEFYALSLRKSGFALGAASLPAHLTFNKAMQVQIGGLQGAMQLSGEPIADEGKAGAAALMDVAACFAKLKIATPSLEALDFSIIVPHIQRFSLRKRGPDKKA